VYIEKQLSPHFTILNKELRKEGHDDIYWLFTANFENGRTPIVGSFNDLSLSPTQCAEHTGVVIRQ
jgi:hypothetical protein